MFSQLITEIKTVPERLAQKGESLRQRRTTLTTSARKTVQTVRGDSEERLWKAQTAALARVGEVLENADEVPVIGALSKSAGKLVDTRLATLTAVPIEDYDALNARTVIGHIKALDSRVQLASIRLHESENKARKTVLKAVEDRIASLLVRAAA